MDVQGVIPVAYFAETTLEVSGTPGETQEISLGNLAEPVREPILHYPMNRVDTAGLVIDAFQGIDGQASDITTVLDYPQGFDTSYAFTGASEITVGLDSALNRPDNLGLGFWFKPTSANSPIVDYAVRNLTLSLNSQSQLVFSIQTSDGTFSVTSDPVALNQWHQVGAAYKDDTLMLEVNGTLYQVPATGALVEDTAAAHALLIGNGFAGNMSGFRVNDFANPLLIGVDGTDEQGSITIGADGTGYLNIRSTGQMTACSERQRRRTERFLARMGKPGIISPAYAANLPAFCYEPQPDLELSVEYLEHFFDYLQKCYLAERMEKARIRIKTADGLKEKFLGYMDLAKTQALSITAMQARSVVSMINCVDGFITGGNNSGWGMVCDFISGFLMYGDIRDFVIHSYHLHFGDAGKFDNATYTLAGLGIITNLLEVGGFFAGGVPGIAMAGADGAIAGIKTALKIFRRVDGTLVKFMQHLVDFLSKNVMEAPSLAKKAEALSKVMPVLELAAVVAFYNQDFSDIGQLLIEMMQTEGAFTAFVGYLHGYFQWHAANETGTTTGDLRDYRLVDEAYAAPLARGPVQDFIDIIRSIKNDADAKNIKEIGKKLDRVIKELKLAKASEFTDITAEMYKNVTLKAFLYTEEIGPDAMRHLRNFKGSANIAHAKLFEMISKLPIDELTMNPQIKEGLEHVFKDLATVFNKAHGAAHQLKLIHYYIKSNNGIIQGVEVAKRIRNEFGDIGERVYDAVIKIGDVEYLYDSKAWTPDKIKARLLQSLKGDPVAGENPGQLFKDIIKLYKETDPNKRIRWAFDSRSSGLEGKIKDWILEGIDKNRKKIAKTLNIDPKKTGDQWIKFRKKIDDKLNDFVEVVPDEIIP
jgi:hypothetical protein